MKFFVNFLSAFRIAAAFAIIATLMDSMYITSFILFIIAALTDFFDGLLARKYNVCSKLGGVMDHIGDKLLVVNTFIMLCVMTPIFVATFPMWGGALALKSATFPIYGIVIPVIIMVARELYVSGLREFLGTQKIEMPVPKARFSMGKIKTTFQMIAIVLLLMFFAGLNLLSIYPTTSIIMIRIIRLAPYCGIISLWLALIASIWSATQYTINFVQKLKKIK